MRYIKSLNPENDSILALALENSCQNKFQDALKLLIDKDDIPSVFVKGLCCLNIGENETAYKYFKGLLERKDRNFLTPALCDYITGASDETDRMYKGEDFSRCFCDAAKSSCFQAIYKAVDNTIRSFFYRSADICFIDIGIGTAEQVRRCVDMMNESNAKSLTIIGVEPHESMQKSAKATIDQCIKNSELMIEYHIIPKKAQDLVLDDFTSLIGDKKVDIVNASASIHHMGLNEKKKFLSLVAKLNPQYFILSDADSEHESDLAQHSFELISNVYSFYTNFLECMMLNPVDSGRRESFEKFCYYDARNIIKNSNEERIEYHTSKENWESHLSGAGLRLVSPQREWLQGIQYTQCDIDRKFLITAFHRRPLLFQIVAICRGY